MNIFLWVLQIGLALHTLMGAIWKITNPAQSVESLNAIPPSAWQALSVFEVLCALGLLLPTFYKPLRRFIPIAAAGIAVEMLLFCALHLNSGVDDMGSLIYWLVVATLSLFLAYGRKILKPL